MSTFLEVGPLVMRRLKSRIKTVDECMRDVKEIEKNNRGDYNDNRRSNRSSDRSSDRSNDRSNDDNRSSDRRNDNRSSDRSNDNNNNLNNNLSNNLNNNPNNPNNNLNPLTSYNTFNNITCSTAQLLTNLTILFPDKDQRTITNVIRTHDTFDAMINTLSTDSVVKLTCKDVRDDLIQQDIPRGMHWGGCNNCRDKIGCNNWRDFNNRREGGCKEPFNRFNTSNTLNTNTSNTNTLNYPEVFNGNTTQKGVPSDQHLQLRSLAQHYHTLHTTMTQLSAAHIKNKPLNNYYTDKAQHYKQCSLSLHKQAVIRLMAHKIRGNRIDLHDLYVWEGLMVLDDYVRVYGLNRFYVCVGRMEKSLRMRPEVIKYLGVRGFVVESEGAWLRVSKG